jgi:molybdopterin converting factor small subunit
VNVHIPSTLTPLFPGLTRHVDVDAGTVGEALEQLDERYPGLRDRLCEPGKLRPHIHVYVDKERAELETPLRENARLDVIAAISGG